MLPTSLFALTFILVSAVGTPVSADEQLEKSFRSYLTEDTLETALSLKRIDFARSLAEVDCRYQADQADLTLDFMMQGMSLEEIKASNEAAGMPTIIEEFFMRRNVGLDFDASARAKLVLEVAEACQSAAAAVIADNS